MSVVRRLREVEIVDAITLSAKGQIVIPRKIREKYNLKKGDRLLVRDEDGKIVLEITERYPILELRGAFRGKGSLTRALLEEREAERKAEARTNE